MLTKVRAGEIRNAVVSYLRVLHPDPTETHIRYELGLCLGQTRVDVAAINGRISGWEIKSGQDSLARLARQVTLYSRVLDEAIVVAERRHLKHLAGFLPSWWGIAEAVQSDVGAARVSILREPDFNPSAEPFAIAQLLWRNEAYGILKERGFSKGMSGATRWKVWQVLADNLPVEELRAEVRRCLKARQEWIVSSPQSPSGG